MWVPNKYNHTRPELRLEGWRARVQGVAVRLRRPRLIYSHQYLGARGGANEMEHLDARVSFCKANDRE